MSHFSQFSNIELRQLEHGITLRVVELHGFLEDQVLYDWDTRSQLLQDIDAAEVLEARVAIEIENRSSFAPARR